MAAAPVATVPSPSSSDLPNIGGLGALGTSGAITAQSGQTISGLKISNPNGSCITVPDGVSGVTIEGNEIGPCGSGVEHLGVDIRPNASNITVRRNVIHDSASAVYANEAKHPIVVEKNLVYNVRGPMPRGQMVQFNAVTGGSGQSRVVGNVSDKNLATTTTRYEDHINMFRSSGTAGQPILIACNKLRGGDSASGSGIVVGDYGGQWFTIRDNILVLTANTGIGVAGAQNVSVSGNQIWNRGADATSKTSSVLSIMTYAGNVPANVSISGNRGISTSWLYGNNGVLHPGLYDDGKGSGISYSGNNWQDTSLSAAIWDSLPGNCS